MQITIRDPGSALTHFIAMLLTVFASIPLLIKASKSVNPSIFIAMCVFIGSMILLYGASTTYHSVSLTGRGLRIFRKIDHMMIFVLIAGSYTPICLLAIGGTRGYYILICIWSLAALGMLVKAFWISCPKWFSSVIYIAMGWLCVFFIQQIYITMPRAAFIWLFIGGLVYTIGGVLYAIKFSLFNNKHPFFGSHEIFHLFIMGGSLCHFFCMYALLK